MKKLIYSHHRMDISQIMTRLGYFTFFLSLFIFSFWLMHHTLSFNPATSSILVGAKYWSDFGGHLPQIRSFSLGYNWPPEYPLFPGEPIRYHFLFFALVGFLESAGLRIDWALNIPSALGFFALTLMIFALAKRLFIRSTVAILSVTFFLFNGSFSWLDYLKSNNFSISNLPSLSGFPSFAPWNNSLITAFWNLNIYTNQRHLGLSFAVALAIIHLLFTKNKKLFLTGFLLGFLLLINQAAFAVALLFCLTFFLFSPPTRRPLILSILGFFPFLIFSVLFMHSSPQATFHPGFLMEIPMSLFNLLYYWFFNIGFHLIFIPLGCLLAPRSTRILIIPLLLLFLVPNLFQFSVDMINNHKFFNFFLLLGSMFSAHALIKIKPLLLFAPLLILGGVVDFFPILNDRYIALTDYPANPDVRFFVDHTPKDAVVLNSTWFYHPASLAGRKIFNGYSYFTWSFGYDQAARERLTTEIYSSSSPKHACRLLWANAIDFVELNPKPEDFIIPNSSLWQSTFSPLYTNPTTSLAVYSVAENCSAL